MCSWGALGFKDRLFRLELEAEYSGDPYDMWL